MSNKTEYINRVANVLRGMNLNGLFPSVIIAQAALESAWGQSTLARQYNNHFGMTKGAGTNFGGWTTGQTVTMNDAGTMNAFRVYRSLEESILDHNGMFLTLSRYKDVPKASTPYAQLVAIQNAGYAAASNYADSVMSVINSNNLTLYDTMFNPGAGGGNGGGNGSGNGANGNGGSYTENQKIYKMNTKTLSIIIVAAGLALAAVGGYNLLF